MSDITYSEPITETRNVDTDEYRIRKLEIRGAVTEEKIKNLEESIDKLTISVDALTAAMTQAKGGWKVLLFQGAFIAGIVALVIQVVQFFRGA